MSRRHTTRKKRPRHTVFVCLFADIIQNHPPAHRTCRRRRRRGAAAALLRPLPLPRRLPPMTTMTWCRFLLYPRKWPLPKQEQLMLSEQTQQLQQVRPQQQQQQLPRPVRPQKPAAYAAADDDNDDADMVSLPPMPKLSLPFHKAAAAARAKSAAAKAGTSAAAVRPQQLPEPVRPQQQTSRPTLPPGQPPPEPLVFLGCLFFNV